MQGKFKEAVADFKQASRIHPENIDFKHNLALCLRKLGDFSGAIDVYSQCLAMDGGHVKSLHGRGTCYEKLGDIEHAKKDYNAVLSAHPDHVPCLISAGQLLHSQKQPKDLQDATKMFSTALSILCPDGNYTALVEVMSAREIAQNGTTKVDFYKRAIDTLNALHFRSKVHCDMGNSSMAMNDLSACVLLSVKLRERLGISSTVPAPYVFHMDKGSVFKGSHDFDSAYEEFSTAIRGIEEDLKIARNNPKSTSGNVTQQGILVNLLADAHNHRGFCLRKKGQFREAISEYSQAIHLSPDAIRGFNNRAYCYAKCNLYDKAVEDYTSVIRLDPRNSHAFHNRGISLDKMGLFDKAIEDFAKVIELDSAGPDVVSVSLGGNESSVDPGSRSDSKTLIRRVGSMDSGDSTNSHIQAQGSHENRSIEYSDLRGANGHQQQKAQQHQQPPHTRGDKFTTPNDTAQATPLSRTSEFTRNITNRSHTPIRTQPVSSSASDANVPRSSNTLRSARPISGSGGGDGDGSSVRARSPMPTRQRTSDTGGPIGIEEATRRLANFTPLRSTNDTSTSPLVSDPSSAHTVTTGGSDRNGSVGFVAKRSNSTGKMQSRSVVRDYSSTATGTGVESANRRALLGTTNMSSSVGGNASRDDSVRSNGSLGYGSTTAALSQSTGSYSTRYTSPLPQHQPSQQHQSYTFGSPRATRGNVGSSSSGVMGGRPVHQTMRSETPPPPPPMVSQTSSPSVVMASPGKKSNMGYNGGSSGVGSKGVVMMSARVKHNTSPGATATSSGTFQPSHVSTTAAGIDRASGMSVGGSSGGSVSRNRPTSASLSGGLLRSSVGEGRR